MDKVRLFDGISQESVGEMMACFAAVQRSYAADATVLSYSEHLGSIGVVLSGEINVESLDAEGNITILETVGHDGVFGEMFSLPVEPLSYTATAKTPCEVLFIGFDHVVRHCERACDHHNRLVNNLFRISAEKAQSLSKRISLLSQRSMRQKLTLYLEYLSAEKHSARFELPMPLSELAGYLSMDRSAMMRELGRMRADGLIQSSGRRFELLDGFVLRD